MAEVMKHVVGGCPDLETIAAYLDGRLSDRERARIPGHIAACEDCYFVFSEAAQTRPVDALEGAAGDQGWRAWFTAPKVFWPSAAAVLATAAMALLFVGSGRLAPWRQGNAELQALVAAVGTDRPIEARLTGGFAYGAMRGAVRSAESFSLIVSPDVRIAAAEVEKHALGRRAPQARRMLGLAYLVTADIGRAVAALEDAAGQPSPDGQVLSDLSAAYIARGIGSGQLQDFTKALAAADRAVKAQPRLAEAWFNRAFALERLSLVDEARAAWEEYLKIDDQSGWADEARQHLRGLR